MSQLGRAGRSEDSFARVLGLITPKAASEEALPRARLGSDYGTDGSMLRRGVPPSRTQGSEAFISALEEHAAGL